MNLEVSYYESKRSKAQVVITLEQFIAQVRSARWQTSVENYRKLKEAGKEEEAAAIKDGMPGIAYAGVFDNGRKAKLVTRLSSVACVDVDKYPGDICELSARLRRLPCVLALFVSISGHGVKVFFRVDGLEEAGYADTYKAVMFYVASQIKFPADAQCSDISRLCFASHDPEAYYNPRAEPFRVPARDTVLGWFLDVFEAENPFVSGSRHENALKLGREAKKRGFAFDELTTAAEKRFTSPGFGTGELNACLRDGYQYVNTSGKGVGFTTTPPNPFSTEEEKFEAGEALRDDTATFPDGIFSRLPLLLTRGLTAARGVRERDMLLAGMLAVLSGCLPECRARYDRRTYSAHFYFFGVANAGAGKGVVDFAHLLALPLHNYYWDRGKEAMEQYERLKEAWDEEKKNAAKKKRKADIALKPTEPRVPYLLIPPNASKIRLLMHLRDNRDMGGIINSSETDTLTYSLRQDCGGQDDLLRNATHHEATGASHKVNGDPIIIPSPRLAMCLTGTPGQFVNLLQSSENGLLSRFFTLTHGGVCGWRSAAPDTGGEDYTELFHTLGAEVLEMSLFLQSSRTFVCFTADQWRRHTEQFSRRLAEVSLERRGAVDAVVFRHGLLVMRVAMVLTALRKWENRWHTIDMVCSDDDFDAALRIVLVSLEHSILLSTSLDTNVGKSRPLTPFFRIRAIFELLPKNFKYSDFETIGKSFGYSESSVKRYVSRAVKMQVIKKKQDGMYVKLVSSMIEEKK